MKHIKSNILAVLAALAISASANAVTLLEVDFDSLPTGAVTAANLNGVTSGSIGASWFLNTGRGAVHTIEADNSGNGDLALLSDDTNGGNAGDQQLNGFNMTGSGVDIYNFGGSSLLIEFETASRRSGNNKNLHYQLRNADSSTILDIIRWSNNGNVTVNGVVAGSGPTLGPNVNPWDSTSPNVYDVSLLIDSSGNVVGSFAGINFTTTLMGSNTDTIDRFQFFSGGSSNSHKGGYLNDIKFSSVPEPTTVALGVLGMIGLTFRRRRQA